MKKFFEKHMIAKYVVSSYLRTLLISITVFISLFVVLFFLGIYFKLENALDLKYNSPFILVPIWVFIGLGLICMVIGFLMYFYKYKRSKSKGTFYETFSNILDEGKTNEI